MYKYFPKRYMVSLFAFLGFVVMFYLRTNLSIAIVAMTADRNITKGNETLFEVRSSKVLKKPAKVRQINFCFAETKPKGPLTLLAAFFAYNLAKFALYICFLNRKFFSKIFQKSLIFSRKFSKINLDFLENFPKLTHISSKIFHSFSERVCISAREGDFGSSARIKKFLYPGKIRCVIFYTRNENHGEIHGNLLRPDFTNMTRHLQSANLKLILDE